MALPFFALRVLLSSKSHSHLSSPSIGYMRKVSSWDFESMFCAFSVRSLEGKHHQPNDPALATKEIQHKVFAASESWGRWGLRDGKANGRAASSLMCAVTVAKDQFGLFVSNLSQLSWINAYWDKDTKGIGRGSRRCPPSKLVPPSKNESSPHDHECFRETAPSSNRLKRTEYFSLKPAPPGLRIN